MTGHFLSAAATGVVVLAGSSLATIGTGAGIFGTIVGLVSAYVGLRANARTARREYQQEIAAAKKEGADEKAAELNPIITNLRDQAARDAAEIGFWRGKALEKGGAP